MTKKIPAIIILICIMTAFLPGVSRAAITPYFIAINDTLLEFNDETMPYLSGSEIFIPVKIFEKDRGLNVFTIGSDEVERVLLYKGMAKIANFSTMPGSSVTLDKDGNILNWPPARRIGKRFYVPLRQVCDYFDLTYEIHPIKRDIIPDEQMMLIRIVSSANFNTPTFEGLNRNALRAAYYNYYPPPVSPSPATPGPVETPPPPQPPPDYSGITVHLSFYDISAGDVDGILNLLDIHAPFGYHACFFVSAQDISADPGLIRRIAGSGHSIGINLTEGTYEEYLSTSAILFEAAKIRTVIVCMIGSDENPAAFKDVGGLILWESYFDAGFYDTIEVTTITATIPSDTTARLNIMLSCSEEAATVLPGVISFLRLNELAIERITETNEPVSGRTKPE